MTHEMRLAVVIGVVLLSVAFVVYLIFPFASARLTAAPPY
jgi:hypothetical protein